MKKNLPLPDAGLTGAEVIAGLRLVPLTIEGGFFRETYRSSCGTCIYYLLAGTDRSDWHKVANDEIWLYHAGVPAAQMLLYADGRWEERVIGTDIAHGQTPQSLIPAGTWQAAVPLAKYPWQWGLFGAVVVPAFTYDAFTAGCGIELCAQYPAAAARIRALGLA